MLQLYCFLIMLILAYIYKNKHSNFIVIGEFDVHEVPSEFDAIP